MPWLMALALLASLAPAVPAPLAFAAESVALPFPGGKAVRIIQGYNGGTHLGRSRFGLDLVLADGETSGAEVVSPIDGTVTFAQSGSGCIAIAFRDDSHSVMLCHVKLNRAYSRGESIARGQSIGTVGANGTVGNNGLAHIHLELHNGSRASNPVPFAEPEGLLLEGVSLPASSTTAVVSKREPLVSSNRPGDGPAPPASTAQKPERTQPMSARSEPASVAAASVPSTLRSAQPPAAGPAATTASTRRAIVFGTESCLKVRKQPSTDGAVVGCLKEGTELSFRPLTSGGDPKWRQTDQGWVSSEYLKRTQAVVTGTNACLNVRESAKAGAAKLGCLADGTAVTIAEGPASGDGHTWYRIEPTGSLTKGGWVVAQHLD
jgi:Peptidase family M23